MNWTKNIYWLLDRRGKGSVLHELQDAGCRIVWEKRMGTVVRAWVWRRLLLVCSLKRSHCRERVQQNNGGNHTMRCQCDCACGSIWARRRWWWDYHHLHAKELAVWERRRQRWDSHCFVLGAAGSMSSGEEDRTGLHPRSTANPFSFPASSHSLSHWKMAGLLSPPHKRRPCHCACQHCSRLEQSQWARPEWGRCGAWG